MSRLRVTTFTSLANPNFLWYWLGIMFSFGAAQVQQLARGWLVYDMTHSSLTLGLVIAVWGIPMLALSLIGGVVADRVARRNLIMATEAGSTLVYLALAVLIWLNLIAIWHLMVAGVINGILTAFNIPSRQSYMPELVTEKELLNAISLNSAAFNLTRVIGPALAGAMIASIGVAGVYFATAATNALAVLTMALIPYRGEPHRANHNSLLADLHEGLKYIHRSPAIRELLIQFAVVTLFAMPYLFMLPVFASDVLAVGAQELGWMMAVVGVGALAGALALASLSNVPHKGAISISLALAFGLLLVLFSMSRSYPLSLALLAGVGIGSMGYASLNNTLLLTQTAPEMRGRVMSFSIMIFGLMPLGMLPIGAVAEAVGAPLAIGSGGAIVALVTIAMTAWRPHLRRL